MEGTHITKGVVTRLDSLFTIFHQNGEGLELEAKYTRPISKEQLVFLLNALRAYKGFKEVKHAESLDIIFTHGRKPVRLTIDGKEAIKSYCMTKQVDRDAIKEIISKTVLDEQPSLFLDQFNSKVDIRRETAVPFTDALVQTMSNEQKGFRFKHRTSFVLGDILRYDISLVKTSHPRGKGFMCHNSFASSNTLKSPEMYEVEIELLRSGTVKEFLKHIIFMWRVMTQSSMVDALPPDEASKILAEYLALTSPKRETSKDGEGVKKGRAQFTRSQFIGPQPVTLELQNVARDNIEVNTILSGYTVTDKADGERCMLFVAKNGKCYLISNTMNVIPLGVSIPLEKNYGQTLLDGEWITRNASGMETKVYAIFDVYYANKKNVRTLPLMIAQEDDYHRGHGHDSKRDDRMTKMYNFLKAAKDVFGSNGITLMVKRFRKGDIFANSKALLDEIDQGYFPYRTDGLIYTHSLLSVGGFSVGDGIVGTGTWSKVYKWKPPHENSIDFQIKLALNDDGTQKKKVVGTNICQVYELYVGFNATKWTPIKPSEYFNAQRGDDTTTAPSTEYGLKLFMPTDDIESDELSYFYVSPNMTCKNGDVIQDGAIIEFSLVDGQWKPIRIRRDKTTPNDIVTAINVWRSINYPVTQEIIKGEIEVTMDMVPKYDDIYYRRNINRDMFVSRNMMEFHNNGVKRVLIQGVIEMAGAKTLLDFACGKAGDLPKWLNTSLTTVYGIDKARDNIENRNDGAYARIMQNAKTAGKTFVFGTLDVSQEINESLVESLKDPEDKLVGDMLLKHGTFDVISCQFAVHYFYDNEQTINNFINNVIRFLRPGGYLMLTFLDGNEVNMILNDKGEATGYGMNGKLIWNIRRTRPGKIKVYMESIGEEFEENIVDPYDLIARFEKRGVKLVSQKRFKEYHQQATSKVSLVGRAAKAMTADEKMYSFLNTTLVFTKEQQDETSSVPPVTKKKVVRKKANPQPTVDESVINDATNPISEPSDEAVAKPKKRVVKKKTA